MESLVVYESKFGNTRKIAEMIAEAIKPFSGVQLYGLDTLVPDKLGAIDLFILGGPTQAHGMCEDAPIHRRPGDRLGRRYAGGYL